MPDRIISLASAAYEDATGLDTGVSHAVLERVSAGELPEIFRLYEPWPVVAFGKHDRFAPGFDQAVDIAREYGYDPIVRLPGGRAAVFHAETVAFSWTIPAADPIREIRERFQAAASIVTHALHRLGVSAAIGEIPGEYCPGEFSIHHAGRVKLAGIGQRLGRSAAHVGGVLVVGNGSAVRDVLVPTYAALGIDWDPATVGSVSDVSPRLSVQDVIQAMTDELGSIATIVPAAFDAATLQRALTLAPQHLP